MASSFPRENIAPYLRQMGSRPQLTREQEYALARRARKGDEQARETLAMSNLAVRGGRRQEVRPPGRPAG